MSRATKKLVRGGVVAAVSLVATVALAVPAWATQSAGTSPLKSPSPRYGAAMACDAAHGDVVLFGGDGPNAVFGDTWTWDGTGWTQRFPAHSPSPRALAAMADDAAHGDVVLFGGSGGGGDTWTWDGTDWTLRYPAHWPPGRSGMGLAYDAARGEVVMFGGSKGPGPGGMLNDTWTWDGTDWTQRLPAHSPPLGDQVAMAYDAARGDVVFLGQFQETWIWNGTDWTESTPAHSPPFESQEAMAYDAARGEVVLYSAWPYYQTWGWNGVDWTQFTPAHSPSARVEVGMAWDVAGSQVVLFGGMGTPGDLGDTWGWNGVDWTQRPAGSLAKLSPPSGPGGTTVSVTGWGFLVGERVRLSFIDSTMGPILLDRARADVSGAFSTQVTIPVGATPGKHVVKAKGMMSGQIARRTFTVP